MTDPAAAFQPDITHTLATQGPLVIVLAFAIVWLQKTMAAQAEQAAHAVKEANELFQKERDARLDAMDEHLKQLDARSRECEADRIKLWQLIAEKNAAKEENAQDRKRSAN